MGIRDDIRQALRRLRHQPGFAATAVATLALGLGANVAIFTLVHALMLRALPVERPDELVRLGDNNDCCVNSGFAESYALFSTRLYEHLREATADQFTSMTAFQATTTAVGVRLEGASQAESVPSQFVSGTYFSTLGVAPAHGRLLTSADDVPGAPVAAVLSHHTWTRTFGGDPSMVGASMLVGGVPVTIVGVADARFFGDAIRPNPAGLWLPIGQEPVLRGAASINERPDLNWLYALGRIRPGVARAAVSARTTSVLQQWLGAQPFVGEAQRAELPRQHIAATAAGGGVNLLGDQFGQPLTALFVMSALVLLIAVANLANLLLARAERGQVAIRAALGASRGRLIRQALTEGVILALAGGAAALVVAFAGVRALVALAFPGVAFVPIDALPSPVVLGFAVLLALITGVLFTAAPAWAMSRTAPLEALSGVGRGGSGRSLVPRRSLAVAQVALSVVLLSAAGLLGASLSRLEHQTLGFEPENRAVAHLDVPPRLTDPAELWRVYESLRARLLQISGVSSVGYALYSPMEGNNWSSNVTIAGRPVDPLRSDGASWNRVGPDYFSTAGTRVLRGRAIETRDAPGAPRVAVVNEAFRQRFLADGEPIGRTLGIGGPEHASDYAIVGVVDDVKYTAPTQPVRPMILLPAFQTVAYEDESARSTQARSLYLRAVLIKTTPDVRALEAAVRRAVADVDSSMTVRRVVPLSVQVATNFRLQRLMARLTSFYGLVALALASLGLYGVTAYNVAQRTREIGVRMALGADRGRIVRTMIGGALVQTAAGLALGVPIVLLSGATIAGELHGVSPRDPVTLATAAAVLLASGLSAALLPAIRAARLEPVRALGGIRA
jgi:predicted permease